MRILLIEDDLELAESLIGELNAASVRHVTTSDSAAQVLDQGTFFDVIICDLHIPASESSGTGDVAHGMAAFARARDAYPGTPVIVFSAYGDQELLPEILTDAPNGDAFGAGSDDSLVRYFPKGKILECLRLLKQIEGHVAAIETIEIAVGVDRELDITDQESRAIRLIARPLGGRVVRVARLDGGLSGSRTLRVQVEDQGGAVVHRVAAKLDNLMNLRGERKRALDYISGTLPPHAAALPARFVDAGACSIGVITYPIAEDVVSLFELLSSDQEAATAVVDQLRANTATMREGAPTAEHQLGRLREAMFPASEPSTNLSDFNWVAVEGKMIQARVCIQHGDLHGGNVLVYPNGDSIVIDFARAGRHVASLDPVTLEFGVLFHPAGRRVSPDWPTPEQANAWDNLDTYLDGCSYPGFVSRLREWAYHEAAGDDEVHAAVYALAVNQFRFDDASELAEAVARRALVLLGG